MDIAAMTYLFIYVLTVLLAFTETVSLPVAALIGASLSIIFGVHYGFFTYGDALSFIDMRVIGLLVGVMIISEVAERSGLFRVVALYAIKLAGGDPVKLFFSFCFASAAISLFLSDVTAIMLIAAAAGTMARIMDHDPTPYFVSAAIMINLGGTSTLIGSVSNMLIGLSSGLSFMDFINYLALCEASLWIITTVVLYLFYKSQLSGRRAPQTYDFWGDVKDKRAIYKASLIIALFILLLSLSDHWDIGPEAIALGCAILALATSDMDTGEVFRRVDWETIFTMVGFFIIVGGIERTGLLSLISQRMLELSQGNSLKAAILVLWSSGLISAVVSNIAVALTFTPVIEGLNGLNLTALWSALVFGTNLGGAATPFSGAVCILCLGALKREGINLGFTEFTKIGVLTTLVQLGFSTIYLTFRFGLWG